MSKWLILIILLLSLGIQAQEIFNPKTSLGIKQGINFSRVNFDTAVKQRINIGYTGGLVFKHISQQSLGIQLELNFSQQGWTEKLDSTNSYSRKLNFINLPFMTHIEVGKGKTIFLMNFGSTLSYLISEKEKINLADSVYPRKYYGSKIDNRLEYGLCLGLGILKPTSIGLFQIECRFNQSFSNIFKNTAEHSFFSSNPQTLELTISYLIEFKKATKYTNSQQKRL